MLAFMLAYVQKYPSYGAHSRVDLLNVKMGVPSHTEIPKRATKVKFFTPWYFLFAILFSFHEV